MKKLTAYLAIFSVLCLAALSCHKEDGEDWELYSTYLKAIIDGHNFKTIDAEFCELDSLERDQMQITRFLGDSKKAVTITTNANGHQLLMTLKDTTARMYQLNLGKVPKTTEVFSELMAGDTTRQDSVSFAKLKIETLIFYRAIGCEPGVSAYYFSTFGHVNINYFEEYSTGNFSAVMNNVAGDSFTIREGNFLIQGKPWSRVPDSLKVDTLNNISPLPEQE